jgi:hypothetical protein
MGSKGEFAPAFVSNNLFSLLNKKSKLPKEKKEKVAKPTTGSSDARQNKKERDTPPTKTPAVESPTDNGVAPEASSTAPRHQSQLDRAKKEQDRKTDRHVPRTGIRGEPAKGGAGKGNWGDQDTTPETVALDAFPDETPELAPVAPGGWGDADKVEVPDTKVVEDEERKRVEDDEAKQMTLEEFRAAKAAELVASQKAIRKVDSSQFKNMKALAKPAEAEFYGTGGAAKGKEKEKEKPVPKKAAKDEKKPNVDLASSMFTMAPVGGGEGRGGRGGRGRGRGGFEGGRGRGGRGGHEGRGNRSAENHQDGLKIDDDNMFPALPPKADAPAEEAAPAPATSS